MADAFAYYVLILGMPEDLFWDAEPSFLKQVAADKAAYDAWAAYERGKAAEKGGG